MKKIFIHKYKKPGYAVEYNTDNQTIIVEYKDNNGDTIREEFSRSEISPFRPKQKRSNKWFKNGKPIVYWAKTHNSAIIPSKRKEDGCYDIYCIIDNPQITIKPHEIVEFRTGIASAFPAGYRFDCSRERGSTGSIGLTPKCGQIDSGYRGEWFLKMQNTTNKTIVISHGIDAKSEFDDAVYYPATKAICQAAFEIDPVNEEQEISFEELEKLPSLRGKGKLGSSNK